MSEVVRVTERDTVVVTEEDGTTVVTVNTPGPQGPPAPDATASEKGLVKLAGDLGGTADLPTVPALANKQDRESGKGLSTNDYTTAEKTKLTGIASGATQNASDAALRDRTTHTGSQAIGTVTGLQTALDGKVEIGGDLAGTTTSVKVKNRTAIVVAPSTYAGNADYACDGVDDQVEINAAIDYALSQGINEVHLLAGTYNTTASVIVKSNMTLRGAGMKQTIVAGSVMTNGIFRPVGSSAGNPTINVTLSSFMIDGTNLPNTAVTPNKGLSGQFYVNLQVSNVYCYNTPATGLGPDYLKGSSFTNCIADSCGRLEGDPGYNGFGIGTGGWDEESLQFVNCHAYDCGNNGFLIEDQAINTFATRNYNLKFTNCTALRCRKGFRVSGTPGTTFTNCTGNSNDEQGMYVARYGNRDCANTQIIGGQFAYNTTAGLLIAYDNAEGGNNSMNVLIDGVHTFKNGQYGIFIGGNNRARVTNVHTYENAWEGLKYHIFDAYGARYAVELSSITAYNNGQNVSGAGSHHGIYVHAQNAPLYGLTIKDIYTYDDQKDGGGNYTPTQWFGVYINGIVQNLTIDNVNARDLYKDGIYIAAAIPSGTTDPMPMYGLKLLNSTVVNSGKGNVSLQNEAIRLTGTSTANIVGAMIKSNHAYDTQSPKVQAYGLVLKDYVLDTQVVGNDFRNNLTGVINDASVANSGTVFFDNRGFNPQGHYSLGNQNSVFNVDVANGRVQSVTLTGNASANFFTAKDADRITLVVTQDGTGNRNLTLPAWSPAVNLSDAAGAVDVLDFVRSEGAWALDSVSLAETDATATRKGRIQLTGDLGGTAASPTVPGLTSKANDSAVVHLTGNESVDGTKTFTSPPVISQINDTNGNVELVLSPTASAVNQWTFSNAATGNSPTLSATGSDTNIGLIHTTKGTGRHVFRPGSNTVTAFSVQNAAASNTIFNVDTTNSRVGILNAAPTSTLQVAGSFSLPISTKTANYTIVGTDHTILCDATSGSITITLPAVSTISGRMYVIKKIDATANTVTIDGNSSETIDGATTLVLTTQWETKTIQSNGSAWFVV